MADVLNFSGQGKGLLSLSVLNHPTTPAEDSAAVGFDNSQYATDAGNNGDGSKGAASYARLIDSQLEQEPNQTNPDTRKDGAEYAAESLFFSSEPLTPSPLGSFKLSQFDGEQLPHTGIALPVNGNSQPNDSVTDMQVISGAELEASLIVAPSLDAISPTAQENIATMASGGAELPEPSDAATLAAASENGIFDDLAFLPDAENIQARSVIHLDNSKSAQKIAAARASTMINTSASPASTEDVLPGLPATLLAEEGGRRQQAAFASESFFSRHIGANDGGAQNMAAAIMENSRQQFGRQLNVSLDNSEYIASSMKEMTLASSSIASTSASDATLSHVHSDSLLSPSERQQQSVAADKAADIRLAVPFARKDWSEQLGRQLSFLVSKNMDTAQIQLDPPELGPLQVRIHIQQDQVALQFQAQHGVVREALDQSVGKLQELFQEEGLNLVSVDVADSEAREESTADEDESRHAAVDNQDTEGDEILTPVLTQLNSDGKIDYFI